MKTTLKGLAILLIICLIQTQDNSQKENPSLKKIIQISPSALDVLLHSFDHVIVFFHSKSNPHDLNATLDQFQVIKEKIRSQFPDDHTLFGYINLTEDYNEHLQRFGKNEGYSILNRFTPIQEFKYRYYQGLLIEDYKYIAHPKLLIKYQKNALDFSSFSYNLLFKFRDVETLNFYNKIYQKNRYFFLFELEVGAWAVPVEKNEKEGINLYQYEKYIKKYQYSNMSIEQIATELLQDVNIDTLPLVTKLQQKNLYRIFGGSISDQILLLYNKSISDELLRQIRKIFSEAALFNKNQQLAYQRVLFAEMNEQFFEEHFHEESQNIFKENILKSYAIIFTKTDYDRFNLRKYILKEGEEALNPEKIIEFIEDVRMKRLQPQYKSEQIPSQDEKKGILKKIVGNTFINEIYSKPEQSLIVLFYDSKDESSFIKVKEVLEEFALKHQSVFEGKVSFGMFDLAKNQHKLLYLKEAPQIVLFDKANKKQSKYFKIDGEVSILALEQWVQKQLSQARFSKLEEQM